MAPFSLKGWDECYSREGTQERDDRFPCMRVIRFRISAHWVKVAETAAQTGQDGAGLSVNLSSGGLCMVTREALELGSVLRLEMPVAVGPVRAPTLGQVRWTRPLLPLLQDGYVVGVEFML